MQQVCDERRGGATAMTASIAISRLSDFHDSPEQIGNVLAMNAKLLCSGVFVAGRDPAHVIEHDLSCDQFAEPWPWDALDINVDRERERVTLTAPDGQARTAVYHAGLGCTLLPAGRDAVHFTPVPVVPDVPDPAATSWPMGDLLPDDPLPGVDLPAIEAALD